MSDNSSVSSNSTSVFGFFSYLFGRAPDKASVVGTSAIRDASTESKEEETDTQARADSPVEEIIKVSFAILNFQKEKKIQVSLKNYKDVVIIKHEIFPMNKMRSASYMAVDSICRLQIEVLNAEDKPELSIFKTFKVQRVKVIQISYNCDNTLVIKADNRELR